MQGFSQIALLGTSGSVPLAGSLVSVGEDDATDGVSGGVKVDGSIRADSDVSDERYEMYKLMRPRVERYTNEATRLQRLGF